MGYSYQLLPRSIRGLVDDRGRVYGDYHLQPSHVGSVPHVLPEVLAVHVLVDETEWVCLSRVHSHERYYVYTPIVKEDARVNFIAEPLQGSR